MIAWAMIPPPSVQMNAQICMDMSRWKFKSATSVWMLGCISEQWNRCWYVQTGVCMHLDVMCLDISWYLDGCLNICQVSRHMSGHLDGYPDVCLVSGWMSWWVSRHVQVSTECLDLCQHICWVLEHLSSAWAYVHMVSRHLPSAQTGVQIIK